MVNGLFVDGRREAGVHAAVPGVDRRPTPFEDLVYQSKKLDPRDVAGQRAADARPPAGSARADRTGTRATSRSTGLRDALREMIACFPVYRSYVTGRGVQRVRPSARRGRGRRGAIARNPRIEPAIFRVRRRRVLLQRFAGERRGGHRDAAARLRRQVPAAHRARSRPRAIEDTAFYIYNRFVSPQRGRRRAGRTSGFGPSSSTRYLRRPAAATGRTRCRRSRRTTPSAARTCGPG